jgi:light-regulated signal transduction histidine kinase (bacteriophytochrome)
MERRKTDREISEFLLRACHDLRTPSRTVRAYSELLLKQGDMGWNADIGQRLAFLAEGSRKIDVVLDGLVNYSLALQIDPATFQNVRMDILLRGVLMKLGAPLRDAGGEVAAGDLPEVLGQHERLTHLMEHLLRNAIEHRGDPAPRIQVAAVRQDDFWLFTVLDNGPGVEADYLEKIFLPFERLHKNAQSGAGLGLAICREIVERHGGVIRAELPAGGGTAFRFTMPAV